MDIVNREDSLPYNTPFPGPPTLTECMLNFGRVFRGNQKTLQQIITNTTRQPMIWLADAGESKWLILEPDHGILQPGERQSIRVTADTSTLAVGEHSITLTFSSEGDETSMSRNTVSKVKVEEAPMQSEPLTPLSLTTGPHLGWLTPQSTNTVALVINNPDTHSIGWKIQIGGASGLGKRVHFDHLESPASHWEDFATTQNNAIILSQSNGSLHPGESVTIYVTANAAALEPDYSYTTNLTLTSNVSQSPEATSTSVQVPVTFHVSVHPYNDGGPKVPYGLPSQVGITIPPQQPETTYILSFTNNSNSATVYWTLNAPPDPPLPAWLVPGQLSGTLKANESVSIVLTAQRGGLGIGSYKAQLYLTFSWVGQNGLPVGSQTAAPPIQVYLAVD
jgi:Viral BACON domain